MLLAGAAASLLPTPMASDSDRTSLAYDRGNPTLVGALIPTPLATDGTKGGPGQRGSDGDLLLSSWAIAQARDPGDGWGIYALAVHRWEGILGRPAPPPAVPGAKGQPKLSPWFVEWLMGLDAGHVTDTPGLSLNDMLHVLGNGVVWQQGAEGVRRLLARFALRRAA